MSRRTNLLSHFGQSLSVYPTTRNATTPDPLLPDRNAGLLTAMTFDLYLPQCLGTGRSETWLGGLLTQFGVTGYDWRSLLFTLWSFFSMVINLCRSCKVEFKFEMHTDFSITGELDIIDNVYCSHLSLILKDAIFSLFTEKLQGCCSLEMCTYFSNITSQNLR